MSLQCIAGAASGLQAVGVARGATCVWGGQSCPSLSGAGEAGKWCVVDRWWLVPMVDEEGWAVATAAVKVEA